MANPSVTVHDLVEFAEDILVRVDYLRSALLAIEDAKFKVPGFPKPPPPGPPIGYTSCHPKFKIEVPGER